MAAAVRATVMDVAIVPDRKGSPIRLGRRRISYQSLG